MKKIPILIKSEAFKYLIFGVLTTLVYYIFMYGSLALLAGNPERAAISETIGQVVSIVFAFFTNKKWVFEHNSTHLIFDFFNFASGRVIFMLLAIFLKWWFGDVHPQILMQLFHLNFDHTMLAFSLIIQIVNITLNYFYSKFLVFRKNK